MIGASTVETLVAANALDGAPMFVHLDLDVIDPEHFPAAVPAPNGLHPDKLYDLIDSVLEGLELLDLEVTNFAVPDDDEESAVATRRRCTCSSRSSTTWRRRVTTERRLLTRSSRGRRSARWWTTSTSGASARALGGGEERRSPASTSRAS